LTGSVYGFEAAGIRVRRAGTRLRDGRSFGKKVGLLEEIKECLASHTADAAVRLLRDGQAAGGLRVYLQTNPYSNGAQY
jgi:hypothetical protein